MGSIAHINDEKKELSSEAYKLARFGGLTRYTKKVFHGYPYLPVIFSGWGEFITTGV